MTNRFDHPDIGILLIRIALGIVFIYAGWSKITNIDTAVVGFAAIGIPGPLTYLVAATEFLGGIAVLSGLFVRFAAFAIAVVMFVATTFVHLSNGFSVSAGGYEYTLVLMLVSLALALFGAGKYSLGNLVAKR